MKQEPYVASSALRIGMISLGCAKNLVDAEIMLGTLLKGGVEVTNDNEGDAYAGWSYACGLANPRLAIAVTPLFANKTA